MHASALDQLASTRLLFLNWRDPSHAQAGGAEAYCYEIAQRFSAAGADLSVFCARHPGSAPVSTEDGIRTLRAGGTFGVYPAAARHLLAHRHDYDAVVDFQNGIPFFSPLFVPRETAAVCVVHHVHQDQFALRFHPPLSTVGRILEKQVSRRVYRGRPLVAVSPSTREGMRRELGFPNPVHIVPNGAPVTAENPPDVPRSTAPTVAVVSRMAANKRVHLLLEALPELLRRIPELHVDLAGDGPELPRLRALAGELGVGHAVTFHGRVTEEYKHELLARAWLTVVPSVAEGWGLTVIEANAAGIPALAYEVPGLCDAIRHGHNGWLLAPDTALAHGMAEALGRLHDPRVRRCVAQRCRAWARGFSWDDSAEELARVVLTELRRLRSGVTPYRRHTSDLAVLTSFRATDGDGELLERTVQSSLRRTDAWARQHDSFRLLLHGCDEIRALQALERIGVREAELALAGRQDLLLGPERIRT